MHQFFDSHFAHDLLSISFFSDSLSSADSLIIDSCRPLFLTPKNEAGVRKLVCTTLRPTLLPHTDLYDLPGIVQFVASYFAYEPLANPVHYPEYLPSPSSVISWQVMQRSTCIA